MRSLKSPILYHVNLEKYTDNRKAQQKYGGSAKETFLPIFFNLFYKELPHDSIKWCSHSKGMYTYKGKTKTSNTENRADSYICHHIYFGVYIYIYSCPGQQEHMYNRRLQHIGKQCVHAFEQQWDYFMKHCSTWINKAMVHLWQRAMASPLKRHWTWPGAEQRLRRGRGEATNADHGLVLTRSCCFGLHTRLGSDFFPTDNDSDKDCW